MIVIQVLSSMFRLVLLMLSSFSARLLRCQLHLSSLSADFTQSPAVPICASSAIFSDSELHEATYATGIYLFALLVVFS